MSNDPFEEFEFRPLTEGLGFHKKSEPRQAGRSAAEPARFELNNGIPEAPTQLKDSRLPEIEMPQTQVRRPVADLPTKPGSKPTAGTETVDEILKTLQNKRKLEFQEQGSKRLDQSTAPAFRTSFPDVSSLILDSMLVTAGTLACMIILLMVTRVDLFLLLNQVGENTVFLGLGLMFAGVAWIYLALCRVFLGYTPGEWVFDQRVGLPAQLGTTVYAGRVLLRATLVIATGMFLLPLLSMIVRQDLAGKISGAELLRKV